MRFIYNILKITFFSAFIIISILLLVFLSVFMLKYIIELFGIFFDYEKDKTAYFTLNNYLVNIYHTYKTLIIILYSVVVICLFTPLFYLIKKISTNYIDRFIDKNNSNNLYR